MNSTTNAPTTPAKTQQKRLILVEGNICAGKSTLCRALADRLGYTLFLEATVENPFLTKYYADPTRYALPLQLWAVKQRFVTYVSALRELLTSDHPGVILDRSIFSDIVFASKNFTDGNISQEGYDYYLDMRAQLLRDLPMPDAVVYLDVAPEECHRRVHELRKRECEDGIPLAYLQGLDGCYGDLCAEMDGAGVPVLRLPWNDFGPVSDVANGIADRLVAEAARAFPESLRRFVCDAAAVEQRMQMTYTVAEAAEGADVAVVDPTLVSQAENDAMAPRSPPSPPSPMSSLADSPPASPSDLMVESPLSAASGKALSSMALTPQQLTYDP